MEKLKQLTLDYQAIKSDLLQATKEGRTEARKRELQHNEIIILLEAYKALDECHKISEHYWEKIHIRLPSYKKGDKFITDEEVNVAPKVFCGWLDSEIAIYGNQNHDYLECAYQHKEVFSQYLLSKLIEEKENE